MIRIERKVRFQRGSRTRRELREGEAAPSAPVGRVPRVSRLMALAIRFDGLIRSGQVPDQAELARLGHVSRARMTQIMNLVCLAPDIQEAILFLPLIERGRQPLRIQHLQNVATTMNWAKQRRAWRAISQQLSHDASVTSGGRP
jgi:hypothetical protein